MWQRLLNWRLRLPTTPAESCALCGRQADPLGDHALCCGAAGLWRRHNNLRDVLLNALPKAGLQASVEVSLPHSDARPADLFISQGCGPRPVAVDISVVHPLSSGFHHSEGSAAAAAAKREAEKIARYGEACRVLKRRQMQHQDRTP